MHEWEETIIEAVKKALEDIEEHADELKSITEEVAEDINALADSADAPYMVHEGVRDRIGYKEEGPLHIAEEYRDQGIKLLGSAGSRMTRLFVGLNRPKNLHNRFEGRFDMRSFTADALDRRTDVYNQKIQPRIDKAAVSFMIDNSGSMGGTPIQRTYQMLSAMLMYLSRAMIPTEAVGFTADTAYSYRYRDCPVYLQIVKQFDDPYDRKVLQRCVPPEFMSQNAEVDCLRWMVPRLYARPEKKKILFILGDGEPCIGNYALNAKLAAAYREYIGLCRQAGIIVFGFGIKCNLSWIFGEDFISVDSYDMGDKILDKLTEVLNRPNHTTLERAAA
jgi:cobalamin biosynthesis protein CobT